MTVIPHVHPEEYYNRCRTSAQRPRRSRAQPARPRRPRPPRRRAPPPPPPQQQREVIVVPQQYEAYVPTPRYQPYVPTPRYQPYEPVATSHPEFFQEEQPIQRPTPDQYVPFRKPVVKQNLAQAPPVAQSLGNAVQAIAAANFLQQQADSADAKQIDRKSQEEERIERDQRRLRQRESDERSFQQAAQQRALVQADFQRRQDELRYAQQLHEQELKQRQDRALQQYLIDAFNNEEPAPAELEPESPEEPEELPELERPEPLLQIEGAEPELLIEPPAPIKQEPEPEIHVVQQPIKQEPEIHVVQQPIKQEPAPAPHIPVKVESDEQRSYRYRANLIPNRSLQENAQVQQANEAAQYARTMLVTRNAQPSAMLQILNQNGFKPNPNQSLFSQVLDLVKQDDFHQMAQLARSIPQLPDVKVGAELVHVKRENPERALVVAQQEAVRDVVLREENPEALELSEVDPAFVEDYDRVAGEIELPQAQALLEAPPQPLLLRAPEAEPGLGEIELGQAPSLEHEEYEKAPLRVVREFKGREAVASNPKFQQQLQANRDQARADILAARRAQTAFQVKLEAPPQVKLEQVKLEEGPPGLEPGSQELEAALRAYQASFGRAPGPRINTAIQPLRPGEFSGPERVFQELLSEA